MRPLPGEDVRSGRSRTGSLDNDVTPGMRREPPQMSYFIADEKTMEASQSGTSTITPKPRDLSKSRNYGVESLETTRSSLARDREDEEVKVKKARHNWKSNLVQQNKAEEGPSEVPSPTSSPDVSRTASPAHQRRSSQNTISRPFTPLSFGIPASPSITSSPNSRRNSDIGSYLDDIASQAVISSGEEERDPSPDMTDIGSSPQLVMPSIKMPSRRPFTEKGKNMGRLKVLVAGDTGLGKTSLIKAIVQSCEDIVHVDPISIHSAVPEMRRKSRTKSNAGSNLQNTTQITEIYASTKAYPAWWSDLEESRILRRRKSMGESVLERNLCFVDTPGYGNKTSCLECINPVIDYIEAHFKKISTFSDLGEAELVNMLSGNGGSQVDVVLYVISNRVKPVDIEYLQRISNLTNVIPLIAKAETMPAEQINLTKEHILSELQLANIRPFLFGLTPQAAQYSVQPSPPYAISSTPSKDHENMDASLLMSPDYVQPLVDSELQSLVSQMFERDTITWLRHSAAKKYVSWRSSSTPISRPLALYRPLATPSTSQVLTPPIGATSSFALARITDHTQREERIAQIRLANWAAGLQRSLQNERNRYDALARSERAVWLTERLGECVQDGTIVPISQARKENSDFDSLVKSGTYSKRKMDESIAGSMDMHDPLGLLMLNAELKRKGWLAFKIISSFGVVTGLALWAARTWQESWNVQVGGLGIKDWLGLSAIDWRA